MEDKKRITIFYFTIVALILLIVFNIAISINRYILVSEIKKNAIVCTAKVINEQQNNFGDQKTYKYLLKYIINNKVYENYQNGLYKHNYFIEDQKIEIIVNSKEPNQFVLAKDLNKYLNHIYISIVGLIILLLLFKFKEKII